MISTTTTCLAALALALAGCGGDRQAPADRADSGAAGSPAPTTPPTPSPAAPVSDGGTISGRITLAGPVPELPPFQITANGDVCGTAAKSNLLTVGPDGGIAGAVVYVETGAPAAPVAAQIMDQVACQYTPHVIATTAGSLVRFTNSDPAPHNVRVEEVKSGRIELNVAQPEQGRTDDWTVSQPGTYIVLCDYHPWMNAYVVAVPSAHYAVTGPDGSYTISGVPAGARTVTVLHNSLKVREKRDQGGRMIGYRYDAPVTRTATVDVKKDATATLDVALELDAPETAAK